VTYRKALSSSEIFWCIQHSLLARILLNDRRKRPAHTGDPVFLEDSMKKTMLVATFLAVGAGSAGVSALSNISMKGSDTLKNFTLSVISSTVCPAAVGISYQGGGSGGGETAIVAGTQTVAPMSKFISAPSCAAADPTKAEGIAFAADGVSMVASKVHFAACQTAKAPTDCSSTAGSGLKQSGTLNGGAYTLGANSATTAVQGWQDVLRLIYLGLPNTAGKDPGNQDNTGPASFRDCNSAARQDLVNHWGNLFENACEATGGLCTQLDHAFRRDLLSGTTDVFRELINAKKYPFCNARFAGDTTPSEYSTTLSTGAPIFDDPYQDFDPIRRTCAGGQNGGGGSLPTPVVNTDGSQSQPDYPAAIADQVCSPKGTLGLVLTIAPPFFAGQTVADVYPTKPCLKGQLVFGPAPKLPGTSKATLCPNGDVTLGNSATDYDPTTGIINNSSGTCLVPASADGDLRCINGKNNFNAPLDPPFGVIPAAQRDGRVFNLHLYSPAGAYRSDSQLGAARNVVGNYSRLHTTRTLLAGGPSCPGTGGDGRCCSDLDATSHIGCLVEADPCAFGFAGGEAKNVALQTSAATPEAAYGNDIKGIQDAQVCIVTAAYPLSRKVFINTEIGFAAVTGQELELAKCFSGSAVGFNTLLTTNGLFPLPTGPVCQDFAQETVCPGGAAASDACVTNPTGIPTTH
jgi:hypothetical protein